jgi:hypothetical protein
MEERFAAFAQAIYRSISITSTENGFGRNVSKPASRVDKMVMKPTNPTVGNWRNNGPKMVDLPK